MKPTAYTSTSRSAVGVPWEIDRYDNLLPKYPQIVDIFSKSSATYGYSCRVSVLESYGVAVVWFTSGDTLTNALLPDFILSAITPALEDEARKQAMDQYAYVFRNTIGNSTTSNSTISSGNGTSSSNSSDVVVFGVTVDTGPGLVLTNLTRNGHDMIFNLPLVYRHTFGKLLGIPFGLFPIVRMYPTGVVVRTKDKTGRDVIKEDWRIKWDPVPDLSMMNWQGSDLPGLGVSSDACESWINADWMNYGGKAVEKFVFIKDAKDGSVIGADLPALRSTVSVSKKEPIVPWWSDEKLAAMLPEQQQRMKFPSP